jgi:hypothetical protein
MLWSVRRGLCWLWVLLLPWGCGRVGFGSLSEDAGGPGDAGGDPDAETASGPPSLPQTGIDLGGLVALWAFDVPSAFDGATFPAFPDASLVATLETADSRDVIVPGKVGNAVGLDGIDDRLVVPDSPPPPTLAYTAANRSGRPLPRRPAPAILRPPCESRT